MRLRAILVDEVHLLHFTRKGIFHGDNVGVEEIVVGANIEAVILVDGTPYSGKYVQTALFMNTRRSPIYTWITQAKLGRKDGNHTWSVGMQELFYHIDRYATEVSS